MRFVAPPTSVPVAPGPPQTFSIVVAAYQVADLIGDALDSVSAQTVPPLEIIVCDDGSTDDLGSALAPYRDRVTLLRQENRGVAAARNAAVARASGDFIVILDPDDVFLPNRLEALAALARSRPDLDILTTDAMLEVDRQPVRRCYTPTFAFEVADQRRALLTRNFVFGLVAVRRERLLEVGGFDESLVRTSDWECWIRLALTGSRIGLVDVPLARYRVRAGSLTSNRVAFLEGSLETLVKTAQSAALSGEERRDLSAAIAAVRRDLALARARTALRDESPEARSLSLAVALGRKQRLVSRGKAVGATFSPSVGRRLLIERSIETTAGLRLQVAPEESPSNLVARARWLGLGARAEVLEGRVAVLSPHLDDAVFSLGAGLHQGSRSGTDVMILTVLAGNPASDAPAGLWDRAAGFRSAAEAARARREEDRRACACIGATPRWLSYSSEQYERGGSDDSIWAVVEQELSGVDQVLVPGFPLAHTDHAWLTRLVLERRPGLRVGLYVEQPYGLQQRARPSADHVEALTGNASSWRPLAGDVRDRVAKIRAIRAYSTQLKLVRMSPIRLARHEAGCGGEWIAWIQN